MRSGSPLGKLHALYALDGLNALTADDVMAALNDSTAGLRENAVKLAEKFANSSQAMRSKLYAMVDEPDMRVRYQLAFSLGEIKDSGRTADLAAITKKDGADKWMRLAVLSSVSEGADGVLTAMASDESLVKTPGGRAMLSDLAKTIAGAGNTNEITVAVKTMVAMSEKDPAGASALLRGLNAGMGRKRAGLRPMLAKAGGAPAEKLLDELLNQAKSAAENPKASPAARVEAVETLGMLPLNDTRSLLTKLLAPSQPQPVQNAALATVSSYADPAVGPMLVELWPTLGPAIRGEVMEAMFARPDRVMAALDAVEQGKLRPSDLTPTRVVNLRNSTNAHIAERAKAVLGSQAVAPRAKIVADYQKAMSSLKGDPEKGKQMFAICAACHKVEGVGMEIGPNLPQFAQTRGADALLLNIIDPNAEVNPQYVVYDVVTKDGQTQTGLVSAETATSVTLNRGGGATSTILRSDIASMKSTGKSLMPEGLEAALPPQAMADLIAYLLSVR